VKVLCQVSKLLLVIMIITIVLQCTNITLLQLFQKATFGSFKNKMHNNF